MFEMELNEIQTNEMLHNTEKTHSQPEMCEWLEGFYHFDRFHGNFMEPRMPRQEMRSEQCTGNELHLYVLCPCGRAFGIRHRVNGIRMPALSAHSAIASR